MDKELENDTIPTYKNIINTFINLIGYLNLILNYNSYKESHEEYKKILSEIIKWSIKYEELKDLSFLSFEDLEAKYKIVDELQTKYICNDLLGSESEFSDYVVNWFWSLRVIYKNYMFEKDGSDGD